MPAHSHEGATAAAGAHTHNYGGMNYGADAYQRRDAPCTEDTKKWTTSQSGNHQHTLTISESGGNEGHNNMMPYQVIKTWRRIS